LKRKPRFQYLEINQETLSGLSLHPVLFKVVGQAGGGLTRLLWVVRSEAAETLLGARPVVVRALRGRNRAQLVAGLGPYLLARTLKVGAWALRGSMSDQEAKFLALADMHLFWRLESLACLERDKHFMRLVYRQDSPLGELLAVERLRSSVALGQVMGRSHETVRQRLLKMGLWPRGKNADPEPLNLPFGGYHA